MGTNPNKAIAAAKAEAGYHEGRSGGHWNNHQKFSPAVPGLEWSQDQAWCATFVSWAALQGGVAALYPRTASCIAGVAWFKAKKRYSDYPAIGAQVFYGAGGGSHTGLVYDYDGTYVYTIEGNTNTGGSAEGDGVYLKKRVRRDSYVHGYGYPLFSDGIKSADPAWKDTAPALGIKGIDVSSHQAADYSLTGADFVAVKATEGLSYENPKHAAQVKRARDKGLVVGHYHFVRAGDMKAQADYFLKTAAPKPGEFLALDWEDAAVSCADKDAFLKYLKPKAGGRKVVLYCNTTYWLQRDTTSYAADGLWIARYGGEAGQPGIQAEWLIHQYTDKPVDTNVTRWASRAAMQKWAGSAPVKPKPAAPAIPVVDLSNVVAAAKRDHGLKQGGTTHAADVKPVEAALKAEKLLSAAYAADGSFGSSTVAAYAAWQRKCGYSGKDANGIPGSVTLKKLGARHGWTVKA